MSNPRLSVGLLFTVNMFIKNEKDKVRVVCSVGCPWVVYAGQVRNEKTFQVRTYHAEHTCGGIENNNRPQGTCGLVPTIEELLPNSKHRHCLRHVYNNFEQKFNGLALKDRVCKATSTSNVPSFSRHMKWMKEEDRNAYNWLASKRVVH
ncbi:hypothetical protein AAG906_008057 [Vitis piasezkii]